MSGSLLISVFLIAALVSVGVAFVRNYLTMVALSRIDRRAEGNMTAEELDELERIKPRLRRLNLMATVLVVLAVVWFLRGPLGIGG